MRRIENIDKLRGVASLLVLLYHCYAVTGILPVNLPVLRDILAMGGASGTTIFFVLSGYGIYFSIRRLESEHRLTFCNFMWARIKRIVPQYYFNIAVILLLTSSAVYLSKIHFWNIVSHLLFFHSWSFAWHGAINGVLWTMAVIFQFYLIAIPLYKMMRCINNIWVSAGLSIIFTVFMKWLMLNYLWLEDEAVYGSFVYLISGQQIITSLDSFVCGMCVAELNCRRQSTEPNLKLKMGGAIGILLFMWLCVMAVKYNISARTMWGYTWYSLLTIVICFFMYNISYASDNGIVSRALLLISKYEYGIYLWHLPIINNLVRNSEGVKTLINNGHGILLYLALIIATIPISMLIESFFKKSDGIETSYEKSSIN